MDNLEIKTVIKISEIDKMIELQEKLQGYCNLKARLFCTSVDARSVAIQPTSRYETDGLEDHLNILINRLVKQIDDLKRGYENG